MAGIPNGERSFELMRLCRPHQAVRERSAVKAAVLDPLRTVNVRLLTEAMRTKPPNIAITVETSGTALAIRGPEAEAIVTPPRLVFATPRAVEKVPVDQSLGRVS